jgi:hypothetical protein
VYIFFLYFSQIGCHALNAAASSRSGIGEARSVAVKEW